MFISCMLHQWLWDPASPVISLQSHGPCPLERRCCYLLYAVMSSLANLYSCRPDSWLGAQDCRVFTTLFIHASGRSLLPWVALEPDFSATACTELGSEERGLSMWHCLVSPSSTFDLGTITRPLGNRRKFKLKLGILTCLQLILLHHRSQRQCFASPLVAMFCGGVTLSLQVWNLALISRRIAEASRSRRLSQ